ncbi:MAG: heat-inducible transcriptional repressor HrcA [Elusimicrobiota bacterium]|jgi:heat-inducible transcriptional repressor|nr:heat-inducible transcriptional repressor HrcA [Elusimicrobiota bacterium]
MRILKPEIAKEREEKILRMIIQEFVESRKPVGSELVSQKGLPGVSSATIRNTMKKLEEEGFLYQPHASGGRIPTDKAYRFYVDYLSKIQKIAAKEREKIEREYSQNTEEINRVMVQTCKMLSMLSGSAGFVFRSNVQDSSIQRLDFLPLGAHNILAVLVTGDGVVKHWPVHMEHSVSPQRLLLLSNFINEQIAGLTFREAQRALWESVQSGQADIDGFAQLALRILRDMTAQQDHAERLYVEGMGHLLENVAREDYGELSQMMKIIEERDKFAGFLGEKMQEMQNNTGKKISVSIGAENELSELKNLSVITSAYQVGDKTVGILGIVGPKHMEYNRMMSIVNFIGEMLGTTIQNWKKTLEEE